MEEGKKREKAAELKCVQSFFQIANYIINFL